MSIPLTGAGLAVDSSGPIDGFIWATATDYLVFAGTTDYLVWQ